MNLIRSRVRIYTGFSKKKSILSIQANFKKAQNGVFVMSNEEWVVAV